MRKFNGRPARQDSGLIQKIDEMPLEKMEKMREELTKKINTMKGSELEKRSEDSFKTDKSMKENEKFFGPAKSGGEVSVTDLFRDRTGSIKSRRESMRLMTKIT